MSETKSLTLPPVPTPPVRPWKRRVVSGWKTEVFYDGLTVETLAAFKAEFVKYDEARRVWIEARAAVLKDAVAVLTAAGFPDSRSWSEIARSKRKFHTESLTSVLSPFLSGGEWASCYTSDEESWLQASVTREREAKERTEAAGKRDRAVAFLLARGKVYGTDFTADDAIRVATDIVYEEKAAEALKAGGPISFSGEDNCEGCSGWTPGDHRCECGNRRVSWTSEGDFENLWLHAEAY